MMILLQFNDPPLTPAPTLEGWEAWLWLTLRLLGASGLGLLVSCLYCYHRPATERTRGFSQALILLAPLITMVTMAVGGNVAAAFTLVGALAIVRFRTAVRDTRDTVYVIFSVAVGMAMGQENGHIALIGSLVVALTIFGIRMFGPGPRDQRPTATLRLVISPPDPSPEIYRPILERFAAESTVVRGAIDRDGKSLALRLLVRGVPADQSPALVVALLEVPEIVQAAFAGEDDGG